MLACADLGSSRVHLALFDGRRVVRSRVIDHARFRGAPGILKRRDLEAVCYCSVAPSRERAFEGRAARPVVKLRRDLPIPVRVRSRGWKPGADRLCNVLAAHRRFGGACVVVDFGSAVNVEVVTSRGELAAGVIVPGVRLMLDALHRHCEDLPRVRRSRRRLGRTTADNIAGGVGLAVAGAVRAAIEEARSMLPRKVPVIATGGDATLFRGDRLFDVIDPLLTLRGVALAWRERR